jgi:hypothetical protein
VSGLSTFKDRALASGRRLGDHFGSRVTLYRPHTLFAQLEGRAPAALEARLAANAGAASIDLHFTEVDGVQTGATKPLQGRMPVGLPLTIAGAVYAVQATVTASGSRITASIDPPLAAPLSVGDPVVVGAGAELVFEGCTIDRYSQHLIDGESILEQDLRLTIPRQGAPAAPLPRDFVRTEEDGLVGEVVSRPQALAGEWVVQVGERS